ncbi:MAG: radical SAM/SPASM domain-containing protein [Candidatus Aenigmatarchaeota archaeon]
MKYDNKFQVVKDYVLKTLSYYLDYPLVKPERVNIATTFSCPLNCQMCSIPDNDDVDREELDIEQWKEIVDQVVDWGIDQISFSGGETLTKKEKTLELMRYAHEKGVEIDLMTNGYFLDEEVTKEVLNTGVDRISLSVDGSTRKINDNIRGDGSFEKILMAIENLNKYRYLRGNIEYEFATVVLNKNYEDLVNIYEFMKDSNFDFISYQALLPDNSFNIDQSYNDDLWLNPGESRELERIVKKLVELKSETGDIRNTKKYLKKMPEYFRKKDGFKYGKCMAGYEVIHIDPYGGIDFCGFDSDIDLSEEMIQDVWKGPEYKKLRKNAKKCTRPCLLLCYRKLDLEDMLRTHFEASIADEK